MHALLPGGPGCDEGRPGTRLLDVGCGGGFALLLAARRGAAVSGIDATAALVEIARERIPGAPLAVGDLEDPLPYDAGAFDVITAFNSVQFTATRSPSSRT